MSITFPGESTDYRTARNALLEREIGLRREIAAVAEQRSKLPAGGIIPQNYVFEQEGASGVPVSVKMSQLFQPGKDTLAIYSFMFMPDMEQPCPGCTGLIDSLGRTVEYIRDRINFAFVADSPLPRILNLARKRGWYGTPLLSTAGNTYNRDYHGLHPDGFALPMFNVFQRTGDEIHHFWGAELLYAPSDPGMDSRSNDMWDALWNILDLTPEGRGTDWDAPIDFETPYPPAKLQLA